MPTGEHPTASAAARTPSEAAETSQFRAVVRDFLFLSSSRYAGAVVGIVRGMLIPRFLAPGIYGVYKTYQILSELSRVATLGIVSALFREVPIALARKDRGLRDRLLDNGFWSMFLSAVPLAVALLLGGSMGWIRFADVPITAWFLLFVPLLFVDRLRVLFDVVLTGQKQFALQSKIRLLEEGLSTAVYIGATWKFGFPGLLAGALLVNSTILALLWRGSGYRVRPTIHLPLAREMIAVGFPHLLTGLSGTVFKQMDRMVILGALGVTAVGFYSVGITISDQLAGAAQAVGRVLMPRMMERYGAREHVSDIRRYVIPPARVTAWIYAPGVVVCGLLGEIVFELVIPNYEPGLLPFQIVLGGTFFLAIWASLGQFFLAIKKQWLLLVIFAATIPVALILAIGAVRLGLDLPGVALATAITDFGFVTLVLLTALAQFLPALSDRLLEVGRIYSPLVLALAVLAVSLWIRHEAGLALRPVAGALVATGSFMAMFAAVAGLAAVVVGPRRLLGVEAPDA